MARSLVEEVLVGVQETAIGDSAPMADVNGSSRVEPPSNSARRSCLLPDLCLPLLSQGSAENAAPAIPVDAMGRTFRLRAAKSTSRGLSREFAGTAANAESASALNSVIVEL